MSVRGSVPAEVAERQRFDAVIDARSPAEFALDHIPGAINCPVLDDGERHTVGTIYVQQGAFEARRVGGAMVAANIARHLREVFADKPAQWRPLVYCWRGGMRSGSFVTWLRLVGWDARALSGGYKNWRRHVIATIERLAPVLDLRVVCGATGSAKTRVLQAMAARGAQVLDLEALARHKGSVLGELPGCEQPAQKAFETGLASAFENFDPARPVFVEAESRKIGCVALPTALLERMRASNCVEIRASKAARLAFLLEDYAYLGDDRAHFAEQLGRLEREHGRQTVADWQQMARSGGPLTPLFDELITRHYDPQYGRSQRAHFQRWEQRLSVETLCLDARAIEQLAGEILALVDA